MCTKLPGNNDKTYSIAAAALGYLSRVTTRKKPNKNPRVLRHAEKSKSCHVKPRSVNPPGCSPPKKLTQAEKRQKLLSRMKNPDPQLPGQPRGSRLTWDSVRYPASRPWSRPVFTT